MFTVSIDPVIVSFGHLALRWYGIIVAAAMVLGIEVALHEAKRRGADVARLSGTSLWIVGAGLVGARLAHVLDHWDHGYARQPLQALAVWQGGLAIWGGVIGGLLALAVYAWRSKERLGLLADVAAPGVALASGLGRVACLITGDAVGRPTGGPLGIAYTNPGTMVPRLGVYYVPTPLYELVMNTAIFAILWRLRRRRLPEGALALVYLTLYAAGRVVVTYWSGYRIAALGLNQAQIIGLAVLALSVPALIWRLRSAAANGAGLTLAAGGGAGSR
ncbi:MAG: prolipoprotein diacylglyceryl transferase [Anaerolineae bacterium]